MGVAIVPKELLEQEVEEFLGKYHSERRKDAKTRTGDRDGYKTIKVKSVEGTVEAYLPQLRDTDEAFRCKLIVLFKSHSWILDRLAFEMWTRGLSPRDIDDALTETTEDNISVGR